LQEIAEEGGAPRLRVEVGQDGIGELGEAESEGLVGDGGLERGEPFDAVGTPSPGSEGAELAAAEGFDGAGGVERDKFRNAEAGLIEGGEEFDARAARDENDVIRMAEEHGKMGEVAGEGGLVFHGVEGGTGGEVTLGERVEEEHCRRAALGLGEDFELGDEIRFEPRCETPLNIDGETFGALGGERELEVIAEGVPVRLSWVLPAPEPFQAVGDVGDFVVVNPIEQAGGFGIADGSEAGGEVAGEIQIGLFKCQAQAGDVIDGALHAGDGPPEEAADGEFAKGDTAGAHAVDVEAGVFLFVLEGLEDPTTERGRGIGETKEHEGHQLDGEQFMIGEEVEETAAFLDLVELLKAGKAGLGGGGFLEEKL